MGVSLSVEYIYSSYSEREVNVRRRLVLGTFDPKLSIWIPLNRGKTMDTWRKFSYYDYVDAAARYLLLNGSQTWWQCNSRVMILLQRASRTEKAYANPVTTIRKTGIQGRMKTMAISLISGSMTRAI